MKFFLSLMMLSCSLTVLAQEKDEAPLFPELSGLVAATPAAQTNVDTIESSEDDDDEMIPSPEEDMPSEEDLFKVEETTPQAQEDTEEITEDDSEEEGEDEKEQHIYLVLDDVKATLTPNRNTSFCSAAFAVANGLKKEIQNISGTFTIGSMTKEFKFSNIGKEQAAAAKYMFVGTSCEEILNQPAYTIKTCQVAGWSEKKCKTKVQFVPIPKQEDTLE